MKLLICLLISNAFCHILKRIAIDIDPKLKTGGCFTAHNISARGGNGGQADFLRNIKSLTTYVTTVNSEGNGVSISYKKAEK